MSQLSNMDHVTFPRFWSEKPALWFAQVEAVFALNGITCDADRYDYIITELNSDVICLLEDVILNPPVSAIDKYVYLKREVIKRLSVSELEKEELGEKKPSELLEHLRSKADKLVSQEKIRDVWLKLLPEHVQEIVSVEISANTDTLSDLADKVLEVIPSSQPEENVHVEEISKCLEMLAVQLKNLQLQLKKLQLVFNEQREVLSKTIDGSVSSGSIKDQNHIPPLLSYCWYHTNFGNKATKCIAPCSFKVTRGSQDLLNTTSF